jgi:cellulose synthase/poly-beta-1,6-N-acetylglucosamine synthase-like glycosyltransferase
MELLLQNLLSQELPFNYEIVGVSDGSTDSTAKIVRRYAKHGVRLFTHPRRYGKSAALNTIMNQSRGEIVVIVSADTQPAKNSISSIVSYLKKDSRCGLCWGRPLEARSDSMAGRLFSYSFRLHSLHSLRLGDAGALRHASGELVAVRKKLMERIPSECINEDEYVAVTMVKKGFKVKFAHDAVVSVNVPGNILEYLEQRVRWTTGHLQLRDLTGEPSTVAHFYFLHNPLFVIRSLASELKANLNAFFFWSICVLLEAFVFLYVTAKRVRARNQKRVQSSNPTMWSAS